MLQNGGKRSHFNIREICFAGDCCPSCANAGTAEVNSVSVAKLVRNYFIEKHSFFIEEKQGNGGVDMVTDI
ncbi:hypothetical protein BFO01nite_29960 [Brevibacillus formosus]|uniref:Uncharacterized protein n=1 Tax=Brevibacillus formosus TaxID=54913 RepID=A0ABQ0T8D9_9BACL|nr:hypothetical protein BFO01nite_29960 [Brevibacillus formosus]